MNNKGFTLIELLATIVILSIITGIVVVSVTMFFGNSKEHAEEVFVDTIEDAMNVYLASSSSKSLEFNDCANDLNKTYGNVSMEVAVINFYDVIDSEHNPLVESDLVNPANEDVECASPKDIDVEIYRDGDYVYYYRILKSEFINSEGNNCLKNTGDDYSDVITNLPIINDMGTDMNGVYYICN